MEYKISKERKVELVKEILELIKCGKRQTEIEKIMSDKYLETDFLDKEGYPSLEKVHNFVNTAWSSFQKSLSAEEKEALKQLRKKNTESIHEESNKVILEEIKQRIAYNYTPSAITNMFSSVANKQKALDAAIKSVSHYEVLSVTTVGNKLIAADPELYEYFNCEFNEDYARKLIKYVIEKRGSRIMLRTYPNYQKAEELIKVIDPNLYMEFKNVIGENVRTSALTENPYRVQRDANLKLNQVIAIALEYRLSLEDLLGFIRTNNDYFNDSAFIPNNTEYIKYQLKGEEPYQFGESISFYLYEQANYQDTTGLNSDRFSELQSDFTTYKTYGDRKTAVDNRTAVVPNMAMRKSIEDYTKEETINVARFMYKFALTEEQINRELLTSGITIDGLIANLSKYGDETLYLVNGLCNLKNYQIKREQETGKSR